MAHATPKTSHRGQGKLQAIVGSQPGAMRLQVLDQAGQFVCTLDDDARMLGSYPVDDFMTLHVRTVAVVAQAAPPAFLIGARCVCVWW